MGKHRKWPTGEGKQIYKKQMNVIKHRGFNTKLLGKVYAHPYLFFSHTYLSTALSSTQKANAL